MSDDAKPSTVGRAVARGIAAAMGRARTWQPGRVESYDAETGRAVVQPLIGRRVRGQDGKVTVEHDPPIPDVPVGFPGAGGVRLRFPVSRGDHVIILFCERSLDRFKGGARGKIDPGDARRHNASDAIAIPVDLAELGDADPLIEFTREGTINVGGEDALALAAELADLKARVAAWVPVPTPNDGGAAIAAQIQALFAAWPAPGTLTTKGQ